MPCFISFNPLSANTTTWSNTFKQFVGKLPTNCLSVFDHFVELAHKGLIGTSLNVDKIFSYSSFLYNCYITYLTTFLFFLTEGLQSKMNFKKNSVIKNNKVVKAYSVSYYTRLRNMSPTVTG